MVKGYSIEMFELFSDASERTGKQSKIGKEKLCLNTIFHINFHGLLKQ